MKVMTMMASRAGSAVPGSEIGSGRSSSPERWAACRPGASTVLDEQEARVQRLLDEEHRGVAA